jgi:hypothetical protein
LNKRFVLEVFPLLVDVLLVKVILGRRNERSLQTLVIQIVPGEVTQPRVVFDFRRAVYSKAVLRFPLDHLEQSGT